MSYLFPFHILDLFGTIVFASGGALIAKDQQRGAATALLYAVLTALGGGTIRDLLLYRYPVFWMRSPVYLIIASTAALLTYWLISFQNRRIREFWIAGAVSLAAFTVVGAQTALASPVLEGAPALSLFVAPLMGLLTSIGGGFVRDAVNDVTPFVVLHPGYTIASLAGGIVYSLLAIVQTPAVVCILGAIAVVFLLLPVPIQSLYKIFPALSPPNLRAE